MIPQFTGHLDDQTDGLHDDHSGGVQGGRNVGPWL